jgi:hypothetical protein
MRRSSKPNQKRVVFPTAIVTSAKSTSPSSRSSKQQGRPIPSVFLTQDPVRKIIYLNNNTKMF